MRKDIIEHYSSNILIPIESFIKKEEANLYKSSTPFTEEQLRIVRKANDMFYEKLETFCILCDKICQEQHTNNKK